MIVEERDGVKYHFPDGTPKEKIEAFIARDRAKRDTAKSKSAADDDALTYLKGLGRAGLQGATASFGDEALGALRSRLEDTPYSVARGDERAKLRSFYEEHPIASTGAELAGAVAPALLYPPVAARTVPGALGRAGVRLGALGAGAGAVSGFGAGEGDAEAHALSTGTGALSGAVLGPLAPFMARGARWLYDALAPRFAPGLSDPVGSARTAALRALARDEATPAEAVGKVRADRRLGVPGQLLDSGPATAGLAETVAQYPSRGPKALVEDLSGRVTDQRGRVAKQLENRVGATRGYHATEERLLEELRTAAGPLYEEAYAKGASLMTPKLQTTLARLEAAGDLPGLLATARRIAAREGRTLGPIDAELTAAAREAATLGLTEPAGKVARGFSLETWDHLKKAIDATLDSPKYQKEITGKLNQEGKSLWALRQRIVNELDDAVPEYKAARAQYAGDAEVLEALRRGREAAKREDPEELIKFIADASTGEKQAFRQGFVRGLQDSILETSMNIDAAKKLIGSPRMKERLRTLFDDPREADLLEAALERESQLQVNAQRAISNSATARRLIAKEDLEATPQAGALVGDAIISSVMSNPRPGNVLDRVWRFINSRLPLPDEKLDELTRLLRSGTPAELDRTLSVLEDQAEKLTTTVTRGATTANRSAIAVGAATGDVPEEEPPVIAYAEGGDVDAADLADWGSALELIDVTPRRFRRGGHAKKDRKLHASLVRLTRGRAS